MAQGGRATQTNESFGSAIVTYGRRVLDGAADRDEASAQLMRLGMSPITATPSAAGTELSFKMSVMISGPTISYARISVGVEATVTPTESATDTFSFVAPLSGRARFRSGRTEAVFTDGTVGFVAPQSEWWTHVTDDYDCAVMNIQRSELEKVAERLLDRSLPRPLDFDLNTDIVASSAAIVRLLTASVASVASDSWHMPDRLKLATQMLAIETALMSAPSFQHQLRAQPAAHNRAVKAAIDYMSAHLGSALPISEIAASASVSPRALQLAFQREMGTTPTRWLRTQRLRAARELLASQSHADRSVADIAHATGFAHLGDFARRFREEFGETPSSIRGRTIKSPGLNALDPGRVGGGAGTEPTPGVSPNH